MVLMLGIPQWTEGGFSRISARYDLGVESMGADMLRRFLPGIVATTPNAGYYALYPFLLAEWEDRSDSPVRLDFKPFYRRQEAAFALACSLHDHRGDLRGIVGSQKAASVVAWDPVDVASYAKVYFQAAYGGYSQDYARVIYDLRLTQLGEGKFVDRVTSRGRRVADTFGSVFRDTTYYRDFLDADCVPVEVLVELGEAVCLCAIRGRPDHEVLVDAFFGPPEDRPDWEERRRTRLASLGLILESHQQRPADVPGSLGVFRRLLLSGRFPDGSAVDSEFGEYRQLWRAYQAREVLVLALTSMWASTLELLDDVQPISLPDLIDEVVARVDWHAADMDPAATLAEAVDRTRALVVDQQQAIDLGESLENPLASPIRDRLAGALRLAVAVYGLAERGGTAFDSLLGEGGEDRWSLDHHRAWIEHRFTQTAESVIRDLVADLYRLHIRFATRKLSPTDHRDPFNVADDNGYLSLLRHDEPSWTAARYGTVNHLLWTLGAVTEPSGDPRLTELGLELLGRCRDA